MALTIPKNGSFAWPKNKNLNTLSKSLYKSKNILINPTIINNEETISITCVVRYCLIKASTIRTTYGNEKRNILPYIAPNSGVIAQKTKGNIKNDAKTFNSLLSLRNKKEEENKKKYNIYIKPNDKFTAVSIYLLPDA